MKNCSGQARRAWEACGAPRNDAPIADSRPTSSKAGGRRRRSAAAATWSSTKRTRCTKAPKAQMPTRISDMTRNATTGWWPCRYLLLFVSGSTSVTSLPSMSSSSRRSVLAMVSCRCRDRSPKPALRRPPPDAVPWSASNAFCAWIKAASHRSRSSSNSTRRASAGTSSPKPHCPASVAVPAQYSYASPASAAAPSCPGSCFTLVHTGTYSDDAVEFADRDRNIVGNGFSSTTVGFPMTRIAATFNFWDAGCGGGGALQTGCRAPVGPMPNCSIVLLSLANQIDTSRLCDCERWLATSPKCQSLTIFLNRFSSRGASSCARMPSASRTSGSSERMPTKDATCNAMTSARPCRRVDPDTLTMAACKRDLAFFTRASSWSPSPCAPQSVAPWKGSSPASCRHSLREMLPSPSRSKAAKAARHSERETAPLPLASTTSKMAALPWCCRHSSREMVPLRFVSMALKASSHSSLEMVPLLSLSTKSKRSAKSPSISSSAWAWWPKPVLSNKAFSSLTMGPKMSKYATALNRVGKVSLPGMMRPK
mmetsp:Transcript_122618/g.343185  ORF Transcript_122618/g.343185 Transcript_122618/m.343185 type:complete len:539 (+) Transcript_122618:291-1907(+)